MGLIFVCIGWLIVGVLLRFCFRKISWVFFLTSIAVSFVGLLGVRAGFGEITVPFHPLSEYAIELVVWNLGPWLLFAFLPLQIGYFLTALTQSFLSRSGST